MEPFNLLLTALVAILAVALVVRLVLSGKANDKILKLTVLLQESREETAAMEQQKLLSDEAFKIKLHKIHLRNFSEWLFEDEEFLTEISAKVDELRPAALERYNAKKQEEMRLQSEAWAENNRRFKERVEQDKKEAEAKKSSSHPGDSAAVVGGISMISMDTSFTDGGSCSVDSSSCM